MSESQNRSPAIGEATVTAPTFRVLVFTFTASVLLAHAYLFRGSCVFEKKIVCAETDLYWHNTEGALSLVRNVPIV